MIVLMDSTRKACQELVDMGMEVGQLFTPLTGYRRWSEVFGIDNGAFTRFDEAAFKRTLQKHWEARSQCKFVCAPDIVGNGRRTLEVYRRYIEHLNGWRRALVAQDGLEDLDIPWDHMESVFIGGSTDFKMSQAAMDIARAARMLGKWVHVGRINTPLRFDAWQEHADSCDGSGLARFTWMRQNLAEGTPLLDMVEVERASANKEE